jgi:hypothetical protein
VNSPPLSPSAWVSISEYAQHYGVSRSTVRKWQACGLVDSYRVDRVIRVKNQPPGHGSAGAVQPANEGTGDRVVRRGRSL